MATPRRIGPPYAPALGDAWSLHVADVASGDTVLQCDAAVPRVPASNAKIITAAAALLAFGPDHRFVTTAHMDTDAVVVVRGGGDPALTDDAIAAIARAVAARTRPGQMIPRVVLDQGLYPPFTPAPAWQPDMVPWEVRPVAPVSVAVPGSTTPHVRGGMQIAAAIGRQTGGAVSVGEGVVPFGAECIARVRSRRVDDLVREMLLTSDSSIAEVLARNTAIVRGLPPTWESVPAALGGVMSGAGFDMRRCHLADGSGLSRDTRLRADLITDVLIAAADPTRSPALGMMGDALPVAGLTGTLCDEQEWFPGDLRAAVRGRVRAKTGTLSDTCALSGYVDHLDGRRYAFSLMANGTDGWTARTPVAEIVAMLAA